MRRWLALHRDAYRHFSAAAQGSASSAVASLAKSVSRNDFSSLNLHPAVISALHATSIKTPTSIQRLAAPPILAQRHTLVAAETGAGKTLAYLAPLLSRLKASEAGAEQHNAARESASTMRLAVPAMRPQLLVLVPTRELAAQVLRVAKQLSHVAKFRARGAMGGSRRASLRRSLRETPVDVLVGTPGAVQALRDAGFLFLSRVAAVVVDEADVLLAERTGFAEQVRPLFGAVRKAGRRGGSVQFVYAAATVPAALERALQAGDEGSKIAIVRTQRLHKATAAGDLKTKFIRVDGGDDTKFREVVEIVRTALGQKESADRVLIFCDEEERREQLAELLRVATGRDVVHLSGSASRREEREEDWERFLGADGGNGTRVGVCAKSFGRGIDHQGIRTVVLVDVPLTGAEYLHRVGRVRGKGQAFVLVGRKERAVAEALFLAHGRGERVVGVRPGTAWEGFTTAGRNRVKAARAVDGARWVDKRGWVGETATGTWERSGERGGSGGRTSRGKGEGRRDWSRDWSRNGRRRWQGRGR